MLQKVCIDEKNQNRILHYNLQWFAKDGEGGEKTEPATAKKLKDAREEGRAEGLIEGRAEIRAELNEFKLLNKCLLKAKRYSDLERATEDIEYQKKLLKEFGIE